MSDIPTTTPDDARRTREALAHLFGLGETAIGVTEKALQAAQAEGLLDDDANRAVFERTLAWLEASEEHRPAPTLEAFARTLDPLGLTLLDLERTLGALSMAVKRARPERVRATRRGTFSVRYDDDSVTGRWLGDEAPALDVAALLAHYLGRRARLDEQARARATSAILDGFRAGALSLPDLALEAASEDEVRFGWARASLLEEDAPVAARRAATPEPASEAESLETILRAKDPRLAATLECVTVEFELPDAVTVAAPSERPRLTREAARELCVSLSAMSGWTIEHVAATLSDYTYMRLRTCRRRGDEQGIDHALFGLEVLNRLSA